LPPYDGGGSPSRPPFFEGLRPFFVKWFFKSGFSFSAGELKRARRPLQRFARVSHLFGDLRSLTFTGCRDVNRPDNPPFSLE